MRPGYLQNFGDGQVIFTPRNLGFHGFPEDCTKAKIRAAGLQIAADQHAHAARALFSTNFSAAQASLQTAEKLRDAASEELKKNCFPPNVSEFPISTSSYQYESPEQGSARIRAKKTIQSMQEQLNSAQKQWEKNRKKNSTLRSSVAQPIQQTPTQTPTQTQMQQIKQLQMQKLMQTQKFPTH